MPLLLPSRERRRVVRHQTPSATKEPFPGPSDATRGVATRWAFSPPFHLRLPFFADLLPRAESPWALPAATGRARLDLTTLDDFCNHTKGRAHRADVRTSREAPFLGPRIPGRPEGPRESVSGGVAPALESAGPTGRSRPSQRARGGSRGQLELLRVPRCRQLVFSRGWNPVSEPADQDPSADQPRERHWPLDGPGALSTFRKPGRNAFPSGPSSESCPRASPVMNAPFSRARSAGHDGRTAPLLAATHSRGPFGFRSVSR
jgi:hypothetical protein